MALPPAWKVKREIWRLREQARGVIAPLYEMPRQRLHDLLRLPRLPVRNGDLPLGPKIALVIVFQPKGIAASTLFTFDHLVSRGWTPIAVSNARLSPSDVEQLTRRTARIVERPNAGYDFGAYRDGILTLDRLGIAPERLILMNDSTWFPLTEEDTSLERMEALGADVAGHILKIEDIKNRKRDHIESHCLMIGPAMLQSDAFLRFWRGYVMSDYRDTTIERGEKAFSQLAIKGPYHEEALLDREKMLALLSELDDDTLIDVMENIVHHRRPHHDMLERMIATGKAGGAGWRTNFLDWAHYELSHSLQHLISSTFIYPAVRHGGIGFLKKSKEMRFHFTRKRVIEMDDRGVIPPLHPAVRQEILKMIETWSPPYEWRKRPEHRARDLGERLGP